MILLFASNCFSQIKYDYNKFPDSNDEKYFFDLLFHGNGSYNDYFTFLKVEVLEKPLFFLVTKGAFKEYLKIKFNTTDSIAKNMEENYFRSKIKFSLADTIYFYKQIKINTIKFYSDTILNKYKSLDLVIFLNQYCVLPNSDISMPVIAFMYDKRMFLDLSYEKIGGATIVLLRNKYNVFWDNEKKKWVYKK